MTSSASVSTRLSDNKPPGPQPSLLTEDPRDELFKEYAE
eukprot:CAMPEP_0114484218 /NCGR_PEP_ID=MMETSP0104-20121206/19295_1 /TAXON_ID=37642 ORGANISM="Paraphysomonas imperforata, Strain PA2" /NCGR_SAMPLE_ID=MMETSP0104 /ASSEMBLY_ACC=CAM_ASM_000202 /LENGTH=38 /DNA_ID= /DNA_START= /DNA_END= /DNA_ORIENTATION=